MPIFSRTATLVTIGVGAAGAAAQCTPEITQSFRDGPGGEGFGDAIDIDAGSCVVGNFNGDRWGPDAGVAFAYDVDGVQWTLAETLVALDGGPGHNFGRSVAISGDRILVGAPRHDALAESSGAVYVFERDDDAWDHAATIFPTIEGTEFGWSVSLSGTTALIGAPQEPGGGAAYVFDLIDGDWTQTARLTPAAPSDRFGWSVEIQNDKALVGTVWDDTVSPSAGAGFPYRLDGESWIALDPLYPAAQTPSWFTSDVEIDGDHMLIGAPAVNFIYAYVWNDGQWEFSQFIYAGQTHESFGRDLGLSGDVAVTFAFQNEQFDYVGTVFVLQRQIEGNWRIEASFEPPDFDFGLIASPAAALEGQHALIGAVSASPSGVVYAIDLNCGRCLPDLNNDGLLDITDFIYFQIIFQFDDPLADCDANETLDILDFVCFQQLFQDGCD